MKTTPKIVFFDIDGTLYSMRTNRIPSSALDAIRKLRDRGILVFLATGRHKVQIETLPQFQGLEYDGGVTLNGSYCYDQNGVIFHNPVCREDIAGLLEKLQQDPIPCGFIEESQSYVNFYNNWVYDVHKMIHTPLLPIGDLGRGLENPIYQVLLYLKPEDSDALPFMPHCRSTRWHTGGLDIIPATGGKSLGIQKILEHYGISREETLAFGDGENDLDMFEAVGFSVAMGNAVPRLRESADFITADVDDDGIAKALKQLGLING